VQHEAPPDVPTYFVEKALGLTLHHRLPYVAEVHAAAVRRL